jgi:phosphate transport system protein
LQSIEALVKRDMALAEGVIAAKDRVDALQREIEEKAIVTIARRQPMAVDLREIIGALRISNDLEKIGDLAENVAKEVILLSDASSSTRSSCSSSAWGGWCSAS